MISRQEAIETLKRVWVTEDFKFLGEFFRPKFEDGTYIKPSKGEKPYGLIRNLSSNDRKIFYPKIEGLKYDRNVQFKVTVVDGLEDGKFYLVELELDDDENRSENPYALKVKDVFIIEEDHLAPKEFIKDWFFKKGHTPGDASTIARQLKLNELELYTHTKRFIFELIQNADDMPSGKHPVNVEIYLLKNYLLFLHNGKFFDREDVKAISDAAKSTKDKSIRQIGYKGIGFKSVFTDSVRVYIRSADYSFKFDKLHPIYSNFWDLYKGYSDKLTEPEKRKFELEYKDQVLNYTNIDRIPWQIKPIWVDKHEYPEELNNSPFFNRTHQVSIALEIGESIIKQKNYENMIHSLLLEPRFMLFLRNTKEFIYQFLGSNGDIERLNISLKNNYGKFDVVKGEKTLSTYLKNEFEIKITNEDFIKSGLNFQKRELEGGKVEFFDMDGRRVENIPEKLGMLDNTIISLAAKVIGNNILKLSKEESVLFNYLPTSDQRFGFPFLVNGDFVTKTDREFIQIENSWNHYLFYNIGYLCIDWIASLGRITHEMNGKDLFTYGRTYLNLLPESFLDENNEELGEINKSFNNGLKHAISTLSFIIDSYGNLKPVSEVILDETGISIHLGVPFFKKISGTSKELPHWILESKCLRYEYLQIEKYTSENLIEKLALEENKTLLAGEIEKLSESKYKEFLAWFDGFCKKTDLSPELIIKLPFIRVKKKAYTIETLLSDLTLHIKTHKVEDIESVLSKIGYTFSEIYLDDYQNIFGSLSQIENYLTKDINLYERIAGNASLGKLSASQKVDLIKFFESLEGVGDTKYAKTLPLFKSKVAGISLRPLNQLISNQYKNQTNWLQQFFILEEEESLLSAAFSKYLIKQENIFSQILCNIELYNQIIQTIKPIELDEFYKYIIQAHKDKLSTDIPNYAVIPWIYSDKTKGFLSSGSFYWHDSFVDLENIKYSIIKSVLESCGDLAIPYQSSRPLIKLFSLSCIREPLGEILIKTSSFDKSIIKRFLNWIEDISEKEFFRYCIITETIDEKYCITPSKGLIQYYTDNLDLIDIISKNSAINLILKLLPLDLYNKTFKNIGLLESSDLLTFLLNNGFSSKGFVRFITLESPLDLRELYIEKLLDLDLSSEVIYNKETQEHKVIDLVMNLGKIKGKENLYSKFIEKIKINSHPISEKNISDDVIFKIRRNDIEVSYDLKLSDIFNDHNDQTAIVTKVADSFVDCNISELKEYLFKLTQLEHDVIFNKLHSSNIEFWTPNQLIFLLIYKEINSGIDVFRNIPSFSKHLFESNKISYEANSLNFISICYQKKYPQFSTNFNFKDFHPSLSILSDDYSIASERVPEWVSKWMNEDDSENRRKFILSIGVNGDDGWVCKLRKSIQTKDYDEFNKSLVNLDNATLLSNTLHWTKTGSLKEIKVLEITILQPLYARVASKKVPFSDILIPIITGYNNDYPIYSLEVHKQGNIYHKINQGWGDYGLEIIEHIKTSGQYLIDDIIPEDYNSDLKPYKLSVSSVLSIEELASNSYLFDEPYYSEWEQKGKYPIMIYKGKLLPRDIKYNTNSLKKVFQGTIDKLDNTIYIVEDEKNDLLYALKGQIPDTIRALLIERQLEYSKKKRVKSDRFEYSDEETSALKRFFGDEIPRGFFKDLNLAALIKGLIYLQGMGYNISKAEENLRVTHGSSQLSPIYAPGTEVESGIPLTVKCRSAKSGLLYIRASTWNELLNPNVYMYVLTGNDSNEYRFCKTREELINDAKSDYQILRIEATSQPDNIDSILKGHFDWNSIWLVIRMKNNSAYRSIFEKIGEKEKSDQLDDFKAGYESEE